MHRSPLILTLALLLLISMLNPPYGQLHSLKAADAASSSEEPPIQRTWSLISLLYRDQYHNYSQLFEEIDQIATTASSIVDRFTIGQSIQGREIYCLRITNEEKKDPKAGVLFVAHHHGREQITVEISLRFMLWLINGYGVDQTITDFIDTQEIFIIPSLNPDSLQYVVDEGNAWLRKNLRSIDDDGDEDFEEDPANDENGDGIISEFDIYVKNGTEWVLEGWYFEGGDDDGDGLVNEDDIGGVDLNRNYGYRWNDSSLDSGWGTDTKAEDYPGTAPFSEPETQAFRTFMENQSFATAMSLHSGINATYFPWSSGEATWSESYLYYQIYNDFLNLWAGLRKYLDANTLAASLKHRTLPSTIAGDWGDWLYSEGKCLVPMTFEIYKNASSITQGELVEANSSHQIWRWDYISEYFAPVESRIHDLWTELQPSFNYWLDITPRIEIQSFNVSNGKSGDRLELGFSIRNLSPRMGTVERLNVLDKEFAPLMKGGVPATILKIAANKTLETMIELDSLGSGKEITLKIGNRFVGYQTLMFTLEEESSGLGDSSFWGLFLPVMVISVALGYSRSKRRDLGG